MQQNNGDINAVPQINIPQQYHPIYNGIYNKFHGLQILINDTEITEVYINSYTKNSTGKWSAIVTIIIHDHFGLDKGDALNYQF